VDAYAVLQVVPSAHSSVIQAAYRALARHHHPDLAESAALGDQMATINRAYDLVL
jgi:DnaJ-class molecular chaperone